MSDNLSEDEINALLSPESDKLTEPLEDFVRLHRRKSLAFAQTLGGLVGKQCSLSDPQVLLISPDDVQARLSDELVDLQQELSGAYSGSRSYYLNPTEALQIANPMMGVDSTELDDTGLSALKEGFSRLAEAEWGSVEQEFGQRISFGAPEVQLRSKQDLALPQTVFTLQYDIAFDEQKALSVIEVIDRNLAEGLGKLLRNKEDGTATAGASSAPKVEGVNFPSFRVTDIGPQEEQNLGLLMDVPVILAVELGRTKWQLRDVLTIGEGSIIELEKQAGEPVDVLVNNNLIARGEVVVVDENFSVRITEIITSLEQMVQKGL